MPCTLSKILKAKILIKERVLWLQMNRMNGTHLWNFISLYRGACRAKLTIPMFKRFHERLKAYGMIYGKIQWKLFSPSKRKSINMIKGKQGESWILIIIIIPLNSNLNASTNILTVVGLLLLLPLWPFEKVYKALAPLTEWVLCSLGSCHHTHQKKHLKISKKN